MYLYLYNIDSLINYTFKFFVFSFFDYLIAKEKNIYKNQLEFDNNIICIYIRWRRNKSSNLR